MLQLEFGPNQTWLVDESAKFPVQDFDSCRMSCSGAVFLLASGASAADFPVKVYEQLPFVAMNGSIVRCAEEGISPFYYICDDPNFVIGRPDLAAQGVALSTHVAMSLEALQALHEADHSILRGKSIRILVRANRYHNRPNLSDRAFAWAKRRDEDMEVNFSLFRKKPNRIGFSKNLSKGYFVSRTIPYAGVQLAYHLGFRHVFIVGMDLTKSAGRFYESSGNVQPTSLDEHFEDYIKASFQLMSERVCNRDFQVFNLSSTSRLPETIVPKIGIERLNQLLETKGQ
jgi:Kdo-III transferase WaaZ